jgi:histidine triad (HIT) family protein
MDDCIFCKIAKKEAPSVIEFENETIVAFKNIAPVAEIHILIIPKVHVESILDVTDQFMLEEMKKVAQQLIHKHNMQGGYKLVFNGGKYQAVKHLHWHLLGGKMTDEHDPINKT